MYAKNWRNTTLGDFCPFVYGKSLPKRSRATDGQVKVYGSGGVDGTHNEALTSGPTVIVGRKGTVGSVYFSPSSCWPIDTTYYIEDTDPVLARFKYYVLQASGLERLNYDSAVPGLKRLQAHSLQLKVPPVDVQRHIATALGVLDDLIENNRRRIEILEEMARLLYREWFVHFRFSGHEDVGLVDSVHGLIPEGWRWRNLFELADIGFGFSFKSNRFAESGSTRVVRIRDVPRNTTSTYTDEDPGERYEIHDGDTLVGMDGDFHMCRWADGLAHLNQRVARLRTKGRLGQLHLHLALEQPIQRFNQTIVGTTVAHLGKRHLEEIFIAEPSPPVLAVADEHLQPILELELSLRKQTKILRIARDLLLPRLVTGELDVSELDLDLVAV